MSGLFAPLSAFEAEALILSLKVALTALIIDVPLAVGLGLLLARGRFRGKWLVEAAVNLPLVLPPVVTGLGLLLLFGSNGPIGGLLAPLGVSLTFEWTGAALASAVMALPLMVRPIRQGVEAVDRGLEQAAATLGASPFWVFATVTLPLALPGLIAAGVLGFARAFGEFGATVTFAGMVRGETLTVPLAIFSSLQRTDGETEVIRLAVLSILVALAAVVAAEGLGRRLAARSEVT